MVNEEYFVCFIYFDDLLFKQHLAILITHDVYLIPIFPAIIYIYLMPGMMIVIVYILF